MRCYICNYADFSGRNECIDQSEKMPGRNTVHWREDYHGPGKGEFVCSYCNSISERNRKFYHYTFTQGDLKKAIDEYKQRPQPGARPEQEDQEAALALSTF
jgi:hypothetical protein